MAHVTGLCGACVYVYTHGNCLNACLGVCGVCVCARENGNVYTRVRRRRRSRVLFGFYVF